MGEGDLTLENVSIGGRLVVRGGGNSILIKGSTIGSVVIGKENGAVRVNVDNAGRIEYIAIADGKGRVDAITVENEAIPVILKNAKVNTLEINGDKTEIFLVGSTKVSTVNVAEDVEDVKLDGEMSTSIGTINADSDMNVTGDGQIGEVKGNGKLTDEKGEEGKPTTRPTGGGHSHSYAAEWTTDETNHRHASTCGHAVTDGKNPHTWNNGVITTPAGCTSAGAKIYTCMICSATKTAPATALGHDFASGETKSDAEGHWRVCGRTGCTATDTKNPHSCDTNSCAQQANCDCGYTKPAREHSWGAWSKVDMEMFSRKETAKILGISLKTLDALREDKRIGYYQVRPGCKVQFTQSQIDKYLKKSEWGMNTP